MKPLPKWMSVLGQIAATYGALEAAGLFNILPPVVRGVVIAVGAGVSAFAHSYTGTGGK